MLARRRLQRRRQARRARAPARRPLLLYRGNGAGGWVTGAGEPIGSGWQSFTALAAGGDFSGDGKPDVLARQPDGTLLLYRGNGAGGWVTGAGEPIGTGWGSLGAPDAGGPVAAAARRRPRHPSAPLPDGRVRLSAGIRCTPPGGRLRVSLRVRRRPGGPRRACARSCSSRAAARGGPTGGGRTSCGCG